MKPDPLIGATLGSYRIVEHVGDGGMGSVYRAVDDLLERDVALKFLRPVLVGHPEIVERFRIEAVALARLQHANIATLFGLVRSDDRMFMVMEFVRGETVQALVEREGKLPADLALSICDQALQALEYAHRSGVVHRDIKPANLMLTADGQVKLMDFGVARVLGTERYTRTGLAVGTVTYMSPEQINGPGVDVDGRSDIYSLGIVLYQLVTGRVPFQAESEYALMHAHLNTPPPALSAIADVPPAVEAIVLRAMEKQPAQRFQTPADFRNAIAEARKLVAGAARKSGPRRAPRPAADGGKRRKLTDPGAATVEVRAIKPRTSAAKTTPAAAAAPPAVPPVDPTTLETRADVQPEADIAGPTVIATAAPAPAAPRPAWMKVAIPAVILLVVVAGIGWMLLLNAGRPDQVELAQAPAAPPPIQTEIQRPSPPTAEEVARLSTAPVPPPAATPAPSAATPAAPANAAAPAPVAEPAPTAAPPATSGAPARSFDNVTLVIRDGDNNRERDVRLTFSPAGIVVADRRSGETLSELPYTAISGATYIQAREPRWQNEGARVDLAPRRGSVFSFLGSSPHWLTLQTASSAVALQVDGGVRRQVLTELASRGIKAEEPR